MKLFWIVYIVYVLSYPLSYCLVAVLPFFVGGLVLLYFKAFKPASVLLLIAVFFSGLYIREKVIPVNILKDGEIERIEIAYRLKEGVIKELRGRTEIERIAGRLRHLNIDGYERFVEWGGQEMLYLLYIHYRDGSLHNVLISRDGCIHSEKDPLIYIDRTGPGIMGELYDLLGNEVPQSREKQSGNNIRIKRDAARGKQ